MPDEGVRLLLHRGIAKASRVASKRFPLESYRRVLEWNERNGEALRLEYELAQTALVFDLGGYKGQWASDIYGRFRCRVHVFEPVGAFAEQIRQRFRLNPDVSVHDFGLGGEDQTLQFHLANDGTSAYTGTGSRATGQIHQARQFLASMDDPCIDLMKINIEGGEYDLLDHLIEIGYVHRIRNIQVQFHDFVPDADTRMRQIQRALARTHDLTWQTEYVFENWRLRDGFAQA